MLPRRALGRTGISASRLGLAGGFGIDEVGVERAYHELGVNYFFVTPGFKPVVAGLKRLVAAGHREDLVIAMGAQIPTGWGVESAWVKDAKEIGVEYIDVFHLLWVQAHFYVTGKTWPAMQKLKAEGKVRALAISCHDRPMARRLVDELDLDVLMLRYNAAHRGAEREVFATLPERRPGVVAYTATRWGALLKPARGLAPMTAPECYRFALGHDAVDVALVGAKTYAELEADVRGVLEGPLPAERIEEVKRFGDAVRSGARGIVFGG